VKGVSIKNPFVDGRPDTTLGFGICLAAIALIFQTPPTQSREQRVFGTGIGTLPFPSHFKIG
jgi:hypothetical protein